MCGVLAALFIGVPALEIFVLIKVGGVIGALPTLGIIVLTGVVGAALAKHQGLAALRRVQQSLARGEEVGNSLVEAALVLVAGVLMLTPGFLTDLTGIALLLPPIRAVVAAQVVKWGARRVHRTVVFGDFPGFSPPGEEEEEDDDDDAPPPGVIDV